MNDGAQQPSMPSDVGQHVGWFDRFAGHSANIASRAPFFAGCVLLILVWAPTVLFLPFDTWQLLINTATTIVTFLLVALLQNSQSRSEAALQQKLNAIADGLADLMKHSGGSHGSLNNEIRELKLAVGLETHEPSTGGDAHNGDRAASNS